MKSKIRVVVFGGSGFIGSHVAETLYEKGYSVTIADLKKYNPTAWNPKKNTLDNLFDMLIDDKIGKAIAEGGEEAV